ncbi:MAG: response regulator [Methylobacter sp.]|jgi:response regulator RpfG family c-di-GMP phosphodiesterase|nr:response regulator [Methylobacter sp.]
MTQAKPNPRILLLVDDEINVLHALKRTFRPDDYTILTANSGEEGFALLAQHDVGVIISDQRMSQMSGIEFLHQVKKLYPKALRIVLSGYTELESVTSAINEGAIYKFLTKPWDDALLRDNVRKAFQYYEIAKENERLTKELQAVNEQLSRFNQTLEQKVIDKTREILHGVKVLQISQEILEHLPIGIIGIDEQNMIVASNRRAETLFRQPSNSYLIGLNANDVLPAILLQALQQLRSNHLAQLKFGVVSLSEGVSINVSISMMGDMSQSKGTIMILCPLDSTLKCRF